MENICKICGKLLNVSKYSKDGIYKSCPKCSTKNGEEHVYYEYPENFGTTYKRATTNYPDGPQSYCVRCRGSADKYTSGILCNKIIK